MANLNPQRWPAVQTWTSSSWNPPETSLCAEYPDVSSFVILATYSEGTFFWRDQRANVLFSSHNPPPGAHRLLGDGLIHPRGGVRLLGGPLKY